MLNPLTQGRGGHPQFGPELFQRRLGKADQAEAKDAGERGRVDLPLPADKLGRGGDLPGDGAENRLQKVQGNRQNDVHAGTPEVWASCARRQS